MIKDSILRGLHVVQTGAVSLFRLLRPAALRLSAVTVVPAMERAKSFWGNRTQRFRFFWYATLAPMSILIVLLLHKNVYSTMDRYEKRSVDFRAFHQAAVPSWARPFQTRADKIVLDLPDTGTLADPGTVAQVTRALEENPWIEQVVQVQRIYPDQIRATFKYRTPVLAVEKSGRYVLVDGQQVRLPGTYARVPQLASPVYIVTGVRAPLPRPGEVWAADDVQAACDMALVLNQNPLGRKYRVSGIDVANVNGRLDRKQGEIVLRTDDGLQIFWGNAAHSKRFADITASEKMENLETVFKSYPRFKGLRYVKVYAKGRAIVMEGRDLARQ